MPQSTYCLIREPWIPVVDASGKSREVNLLDALCRADEWVEIRDPLPLVELGVYRLLIAIALDLLFIEPEKEPIPRDIKALLRAGSFSETEVSDYLKRYQNRFDLFSLEHPFLQTPGGDSEPDKPLAALLPPLPSGTNVGHFHHAPENLFGVCQAAAARLLTTVAPFMTAGGAGLSPSINGAPPWYVLVRGNNLFETICANLCVLPDYADLSEPPVWRAKPRIPGGDKRLDAGYAEALTWRPRRIRLIDGEAGCCSLTGVNSEVIVRTMKFSAGDSCHPEMPWRDPNVAYRVGQKGLQFPLRPQEGREAWRDLGPLALLDDSSATVGAGADRPAVVRQFALLAKSESAMGDAPSLRLLLYGMRTDGKMKIFEWHREELTLPAPLIWKSAFAEDALAELQTAEEIARTLRGAVKIAYARGGGGNKAAFDGRITYALRQFFSAARAHYDQYLQGIARLDPEIHGDERADARNLFRRGLRTEGWGALGTAIDDLDSDANALERWTSARGFFARRTSAVLGSLNADAESSAKGTR